jgi:hypothetical protein
VELGDQLDAQLGAVPSKYANAERPPR